MLPCPIFTVNSLHHHRFRKLPFDTPKAAVYPSIIDLACKLNADEAITSSPTAVEKNVQIRDGLAMSPDSGRGISSAVDAIGILLKHHLRLKNLTWLTR
jgi:hypothetical protein